MERFSWRWFLRFLLLPALGGAFLAGWQQARALPKCVNCDCKDVLFWQPSTIPPNEGYGLWSWWNQAYMSHGFVGIWAEPPCNSIPTTSIDNYPRDTCVECRYTCSVAMPVNVCEVECDDLNTRNRCDRRGTGMLLRRRCSP